MTLERWWEEEISKPKKKVLCTICNDTGYYQEGGTFSQCITCECQKEKKKAARIAKLTHTDLLGNEVYKTLFESYNCIVQAWTDVCRELERQKSMVKCLSEIGIEDTAEIIHLKEQLDEAKEELRKERKLSKASVSRQAWENAQEEIKRLKSVAE